jgi:hypothetical protein
MLRRKIRNLIVAAATIMAAIVFTTLGATGAHAASAAPAAAASSCLEIQAGPSNLQIWDNGPGKLVTLVTRPGSCWHLVNPFSIPHTNYHGYEYQDLRGHCLWDDDSLIGTTGACQAGNPNESFYGINYYHGQGWTVTDKTQGLNFHMAADGEGGPFAGEIVYMSERPFAPWQFWNFP